MPDTLRQQLDTLHQSMHGEPLPHDLHTWDHWQQAFAYLARQEGPQDGGAAVLVPGSAHRLHQSRL